MSKQENSRQTMGSVDLGFDFYAPQHFRDKRAGISLWLGLAHALDAMVPQQRCYRKVGLVRQSHVTTSNPSVSGWKAGK